MHTEAPAKTAYARTQHSSRTRSTVGLSIGMTAVLFIAVPIANLLSITDDPGEKTAEHRGSVQPPPSPPVTPPVPPEPKKPEKEPELERPPERISLSTIEAILNPGTGSSGHGVGIEQTLRNFDPLAEINEYETHQLDKQPNPLQRISPNYPFEMKRQGISGWARVLFVVDETGAVRNARIEASSHREFESPALEALRLWRFTPGVKDGQNVRTKMSLPFHFNAPN